MEDLALANGDLYISDKEVITISDSEALKEMLFVFCSVRSGHEVDKVFIESGELDFDERNGLDYAYIFDINTTETQIKNHIKSQILKYYKEYIKNISKFDVIKDRKTREIVVQFEYKSLWDNEKQTFKIVLGGE